MPRKIATGHHGTSSDAAAIIVDCGFKASVNAEDWLGDGVYFFQDAPMRALNWAQKRFGEMAIVLEAEIEIRDFIDLLDISWSSWLADTYDVYIKRKKADGTLIPVQNAKAHRLDREVLNFAVSLLEQDGLTVRGIRGAFEEGFSVFPNSALRQFSHVQIAVRDLKVIKNCHMMSRP